MKENDNEIIDVEVVDEGGGSRGSRTSYSQAGGAGPRVTYFHMAQLNSPGHQGLMPASTVTLVLFIACMLKWGFLAGLGFLFFYAIFAALGVAWNLRQVMQGKIPNPWIWRVGNWCVSMAVVSCLV